MPVNLLQYCGSIGIFNNRNFFVQSKVCHFTYLSDNNNNNNNLAIGLLILSSKVALVLLLLNLMFVFKGNGSKHKKITFIWTLLSTFVTCNLLCWLYIFFIILSGDVELNPGPKSKAAQTLSVCHWNLNSIFAHNFPKLSLLRAYVSVNKFDIIRLSETYLDSSVGDVSLEISGYYLIRSDHPSNKKRGGICIYYKNFLPLKVTAVRLLEECIAFQWHEKDSSTSEGISIENITSQFGLHQIINEPTHIPNYLIFTWQRNLSVEPGTQPSLHPNCHHQIIYAKFNLEVLYPPSYTREVWHYKDSNVDLIRGSINEFDWDRAFANKHVDEKCLIFNRTVKHI